MRIIILLLIGSSVAMAQDAGDRVVIRRAQSRRDVTYAGRVLDYSAGVLRLRLKTSGVIRRFETKDIIEIHTGQTEEQTNGQKFFRAGRYREAVVALEAAVRLETRDWVRRDALALLTRVHLRHGERTSAAHAFVRLTDSDPDSHYFSLIPLWWSDEPIEPAGQRQLRAWLNSPNYSAKLIAASMLLCIPESREEAMGVLESIAGSGRPQFVNLARAQQWRVRLTEEKPFSDAEVMIWRTRIAAMSSGERGGPRFLLGRAFSKRLENQRAALEYLWVPLVYPTDHWLAAEASLQAAVSLEKAGRLPEAESLYRETVQRFSGTPFAARADRLLRPREK